MYVTTIRLDKNAKMAAEKLKAQGFSLSAIVRKYLIEKAKEDVV
jgi:hypothetical protein